jgi:riboflavin synthase
LFTGIIQSIGQVTALDRAGGGTRIEVAGSSLNFGASKIGDSIAVNGVCLTATDVDERSFAADVSAETLACTTLGSLERGHKVNLELPATPSTLLGGHIVQGHVDGVGTIAGRRDDGHSVRFEIDAPPALARYIAAKGSVAIDGASLTVNTVENARFGVNIIPHTLRRTIIGEYRQDTRVNLECDIIARYLERLND